MNVRTLSTRMFGWSCRKIPTKIPAIIPKKICQLRLIPRPNAMRICMCNFIYNLLLLHKRYQLGHYSTISQKFQIIFGKFEYYMLLIAKKYQKIFFSLVQIIYDPLNQRFLYQDLYLLLVLSILLNHVLNIRVVRQVFLSHLTEYLQEQPGA